MREWRAIRFSQTSCQRRLASQAMTRQTHKDASLRWHDMEWSDVVDICHISTNKHYLSYC